MAGCKPRKYVKGGMATSKAPKRFANGGFATVGPTQASLSGLGSINPAAAQKLGNLVTGGNRATGMGSQSGLGSMNPAAAQKLGNLVMGGNRATGMGSQSISPAQSNALGTFGAGALGSMGRAFKKGGMVNAKKKAPASADSSSIKPRGASGRGVKACKVC